MKTKYFILLIITSLIFVLSCDKIEEPYEKEGAFIWRGRKVLVFDFTGHKCGNCPGAHNTIATLVEKYGDAVVPVAIHSTSFAIPASTDTTIPFHYDFRSDVGDYLGGRDYETGFYGQLYLPTGLVNSLAAEDLSTHSSWTSKFAEYVTTYPEYLIEIEPTFLPADSTINCDIEVKTNIANSRKIGLSVYILEDHIIQWQIDYEASPTDIEDYEHNHVLRAGMNGPFGDIIKDNTNSTAIGDILKKSYSKKSGDDWVIDNCLIVAFVYDDDTKEVLQAEMIHLHE